MQFHVNKLQQFEAILLQELIPKTKIEDRSRMTQTFF